MVTGAHQAPLLVRGNMDKCPGCGSSNIYNSGFTIECPSPGCNYYSAKQFMESQRLKAKRFSFSSTIPLGQIAPRTTQNIKEKTDEFSLPSDQELDDLENRVLKLVPDDQSSLRDVFSHLRSMKKMIEESRYIRTKPQRDKEMDEARVRMNRFRVRNISNHRIVSAGLSLNPGGVATVQGMFSVRHLIEKGCLEVIPSQPKHEPELAVRLSKAAGSATTIARSGHQHGTVFSAPLGPSENKPVFSREDIDKATRNFDPKSTNLNEVVEYLGFLINHLQDAGLIA